MGLFSPVMGIFSLRRAKNFCGVAELVVPPDTSVKISAVAQNHEERREDRSGDAYYRPAGGPSSRARILGTVPGRGLPC